MGRSGYIGDGVSEGECRRKGVGEGEDEWWDHSYPAASEREVISLRMRLVASARRRKLIDEEVVRV